MSSHGPSQFVPILAGICLLTLVYFVALNHGRTLGQKESRLANGDDDAHLQNSFVVRRLGTGTHEDEMETVENFDLKIETQAADISVEQSAQNDDVVEEVPSPAEETKHLSRRSDGLVFKKFDEEGNKVKLSSQEKAELMERQLFSEYVTMPPQVNKEPPPRYSSVEGVVYDLGPTLGNDKHRLPLELAQSQNSKAKFLQNPTVIYRPPSWFKVGLVEPDYFEKTFKEPNQCNNLLPHGTPTIVGGVGDSGTRGVRLLIENVAEYAMCPTGRCNEAGDNYFTLWALGGQLIKASNGTIDYDEESVGWDVWQASYNLLCASAELTMKLEDEEKVKNGEWGWKTPRSVYFMPLYKALFKQLKFVHVIRDGRDLALGDNQSQFRSLCRAFLPNQKCARDPRNALLFWGVVTPQVYNFGRHKLGQEMYYAVRIEEVTTSSTKGKGHIRGLMRFLGVSIDAHREKLIDEAWRSAAKYETSYEGRKYPAGKRARMIKAFGDISRHELIMFGYKVNDWGVMSNPPDLNLYE